MHFGALVYYYYAMNLKELSLYLEKLESTSSRIEITKILAELFKKTDSGEIDKVAYLVLGQLAPGYRSVVFNIAEKMVIRTLSEAYGSEEKKVTEIYKKLGDLGNVAEELGKRQSTKAEKVSVLEIYEKLLRVAKDSGEGSQERKVAEFAKIIKDVDPVSSKFIVRIALGKLRLGFSDKTILDALSFLEKGDKSGKAELEKAFFVLPDVGLLAKRVKERGIKNMALEVSPVVGIPVLPMLAQRLKSPSEMIEKMGEVSVEPKLDGLRLQIHFTKKGVRAFTRNLNETSWMFPELMKIGSQIKASEAILDSEAVGLDEETKSMANFQTTMTRRRKHEIEETVKKIGIEFFVFDIMSKDGKNLINKTYGERRKILEETIKPGKILKLVDNHKTNNPEEISDIFRKKIKDNYEGVVVKKLTGTYFSGRTGWRWVKMKQEESSSAQLADTVDALVMGYTIGKGKRASFGVGQFLVGVKRGEKFVTTTKVGTGLTDEQFKELSKRLEKIQTNEKPKEYEVHKNYTPDFWVSPSLVVEIAADEITKSPTHTAGLALRFPRLIRFRDDKSPNQATTIDELNDLYKMQEK